MMQPGDPPGRILTSLQANVIRREHVGEGVPVRKTPNPVALLNNFSHLEAGGPIPEEPVAYVDLRADLERGHRVITGRSALDAPWVSVRSRLRRTSAYGRDIGSRSTPAGDGAMGARSQVSASAEPIWARAVLHISDQE